MALDVSSLTSYVDQVSSGLAKAIVLEADTIKKNLINIEYGARGATYAINVLKFTPRGRTNANCTTFITSGTTTFAQPTATICSVAFEDNVCRNTLMNYWTSQELKASMNGESLDGLNETFVTTQSEATSREIGSMLWRGVVSSPAYASVTGNLALCDGILQKCYALSASTQTEIARTGITVANAVGIIDYLIGLATTNTPEIVDELNVYCQPADFQTIGFALRTANLFNYNTDIKDMSEIHWPGSIGTKIVKVNDLKGANSGVFVITSKDNIYAVLSDPADLSYESWWDKPTDALNSRLKYRVGVTFAQPELVHYTR